MTAAAFGLVGAGAELVGNIWAKYPSGQLRLARTWNLMGEKISARFAILKFVGKMFSVVGSMLTAIVDLMAAAEAYEKNDMPIFYLRAFTGVVGGVVALALLLGVMSAGVGFIVILVLAGVSLLGEWLISLLHDNKIEKWRDRARFGHASHGSFLSLEAQEIEWNAMLGIEVGVK